MVDIDKELLIKALKGAGERIAKGAAQSLLKATHVELGKAQNSFSVAGDRIIAAVCGDVAGILKEEFAKVEKDLAAMQTFLEQRR